MMATCTAGSPTAQSPGWRVAETVPSRPSARNRFAGDVTECTRPGFETLWLQHRPQLARTAGKLTGNRHDAEDLVQDSMVRALRYYHRFEPGTNFSAWAHRILYNTHCSAWRISRGRQTAVLWETIDERTGAWSQEQLGAPDTAQPEEAMLAGVADEEIETALRSLPEEFRRTFELASLGGLSYAEISDVMRLPIGTVRSRLFRARTQLRLRLTAYGEARGLLEPETQQSAEGPRQLPAGPENTLRSGVG